MNGRTEIKLAGVGGQGIVLAGIVLAEAAIRDGKNVAQTQSYGSATRGGASASDVIIADDDIDYPKVLHADVLLAMSESAFVKHAQDLDEDGTLIVDSSVELPSDVKHGYVVPISSLSRDTTGNDTSASIVALGIIAGLTGVVSREAIVQAVEARAPKGTKERNRAAVLAGLREAERLKAS
ncbi:MAG: 2-oxoacid:ferredoxin oxidoreductase subunit gamma [Chloroflexota bacterium]|nr:MAG: 2-oxoacid:ferredoxin oxidoreductase subunit gamma [Chloroflexota bacterium]